MSGIFDDHSTLAIDSISKLWSRGDAERSDGKRELISLGLDAQEPLANLLRDLITRTDPRFPSDLEEEGNRLVEDYKALRRSKLLASRGFEIGMPYLQRLADISINSRLLSDTIELVGEVRAHQAVPFLVELLESETENPSDPLVIMTPEMHALWQIGSPGVPFLIDSIEHCNTHAANATRRPSGFIIDMSEIGVDQRVADSTSPPIDSEIPHADECLNPTRDGRRIVARAAVVLGEIGDVRALPVLEKVLKSDKDESIRTYVLNALNKIKDRNR